MFSLATRLATALRRTGLPCDGVNLLLSGGAAAGQKIWHVHLHVVPRVTGDGAIRIHARWEVRGRAELDEVAGRIRAVTTT